MATNKAVRAAVFTWNNPDTTELPEFDAARYVVWQLERGESGTPHIQGYVEFTKPVKLGGMKKWLPKAHFEERRGTREQARQYCMKEDTRVEGPWERGTWETQQGRRSDLSAILTARRYIKQEWFDIRMLLYGCQAQPTKFEISIVQFRKDHLDPIELPSSTQETQDRQAFYHDIAQEMMYNPIMPKTGYKGKLRVLKKVVVTVQPTLSTQNDTTPASKPVRIFYAHEKICDYMYHSNSISGLNIDGALNTEKWAQDGVATADYSESPVAKQRVWLMVRALNTTPTTDETSANTPSYDIVIRKKESCIQG